ncbi:hypothetical protein [Ruegeria sp. SCP11]|uniref:hypothetical protein n=1 Tax=Ruegeria sp. SCP11 TaxID=3141378 RepID=UPI003338DD37
MNTGGSGLSAQTRVAKGGRVVKWKDKIASIAPSVFLASTAAFLFGDDVNTNIRNSGTLSAIATGGSTVLAAGVDVEDGALNEKLVNSDTITVRTTAEGKSPGLSVSGSPMI